MNLEKKIEQLCAGDHGTLKFHLRHLGMTRDMGADLLMGPVPGGTAEYPASVAITPFTFEKAPSTPQKQSAASTLAH